MSAPLFHLIYASRALVPFDDVENDNIRAEALRNNREYSITGFLHRQFDVFVQYVEGPERAIRGLVDLLISDPRHSDMEILVEGPIDRRLFGQWLMLLTVDDVLLETKSGLEDKDTARRVIIRTAFEYLNDGDACYAELARLHERH